MPNYDSLHIPGPDPVAAAWIRNAVQHAAMAARLGARRMPGIPCQFAKTACFHELPASVELEKVIQKIISNAHLK